jgi:ABC-type transporter Mla subunit MlaD
VTLAGVQIGKVESVQLTPGQQADLRLQIKSKLNGRPVQIPHGSRFTIATPLLGTSGTVVVTPPADAAKRPGDTIRDGEADLRGDNPADLSASFDRATTLLDQVTQTTKKVDRLLDTANTLAADPRLRSGLAQTVGNLNAASANGVRLTGRLNGLLLQDNAQVQALLRQTGAGAQVSLNNIAQTTASIRDTTRENRAQINAIVRNLNDTTASVAGLTGQANQALQGGALRAAVANLKTTTDNLAATTARVNAIAGSVQSLSADPKVQSNLRDTVQNIRDSSEQAKFLIERLNRLAGGRRSPAVVSVPGGPTVIVPGGTPKVTPAPARGAPLYLPRVQAVYNTRRRRFRADVDALVPLSVAPVTFARAGVYGLGDESRLILEGGQGLGPDGRLDARAGIYASKLAVGGDVGLGRRATLSLDIYDPNNYHLDAKGTLMLAPELGLVLGGEDLNRRGAGALLGLEYRQSR